MTEPRMLEKGVIYGMSNGSLDSWDKVERGKQMFGDVTKSYTDDAKYQGLSKKELDLTLNSFCSEMFGFMKNDEKSAW
eukprot:CAMPEP_0170557186 /NCGR_PEP_ID=MMETSP0211-20121228/19264_1 /TAXON_ID=311385 /ORGANISM="Pseudokeronopsis sp., Strain OXSARD2" /LENGTH=77 /DNA_ID=CAMNT_0010867951 /DNA_START=433 /DNA_END=663 /DNA_ORIENTATION=+